MTAERLISLFGRVAGHAVILSIVMLVALVDRDRLHNHVGLAALLIGMQIALAQCFAKRRAGIFGNAYYIGLAGVVFACLLIVHCPFGSNCFSGVPPIGSLKAKLYFFIALLLVLSGNREQAMLTVITAFAFGIALKSGTLIAATLVALLVITSAERNWKVATGRLLVTAIFVAPVAVGAISPSGVSAITDALSAFTSFWHRVLIWQYSLWQYLDTRNAMEMVFGSGWRASFQTPIAKAFHQGGGGVYVDVGGAQSMHSSALTILFDFGLAGFLAVTGAVYYVAGRSYGDLLTTMRMRATIAFFTVVCSVTLNFYYDYILIYLAFCISTIFCQKCKCRQV